MHGKKLSCFCCVIGAALILTGCGGGGGSIATPAVTTAANSVDQTSNVNGAVSPETSAVFGTETPRSSDAFVDSAGINTHFHYLGTPYVKNYSTVRDLLKGLGIRHVRDTMDYDTWQPYFDHLSELASFGIHADVITKMGESLSSITAFAGKVPNAVEAIEAPNEYDLSGDANWVAKVIAYQKTLYSGVKSSRTVSSLPVLGPSITSYEGYRAVGDLSGYLDEGNMHDYFGAHYPGNIGGAVYPPGRYGSLQYFLGCAQYVSGSKAIASTEIGYQDAPASNSVSPAIKARYTMRTLLDQWNGYVSRTYFYELVDEGGQSYGLISPGLTLKPVYVALQNMLRHLTDPGPSPALRPLTYSITGADGSVRHVLLQKRDGSYHLMLWIEQQATDPVVPTETVTLDTPTRFGTIVQYQWQDSGNVQTIPLAQASDGTIKLKITDRVTELALTK